MSAFVVDQGDMHAVIRVLFATGEAAGVLKAANVRGMDEASWLGRRLFAMNIEAVWQRYPGDRDNALHTPGPGVDFTDWPETYVAPEVAGPLTTAELVKGSERVGSLCYQCGEGNVPETWPEYAALMAARDRLRPLAEKAEREALAEKLRKREPSEWVDVKEAAKLMRGALKAKWPRTKFSVRIDRYSMGCSTDISWVDGPAAREVDALVGPYSGDRFDGSDDSTYVVQSWLFADGSATHGDPDAPIPAGAKRVKFSGSRPHTSREITPEWQAKCARAWAALDGHAQCELLNHPKFQRWAYEREADRPGYALALFLGETDSGDAAIVERV